MDGGAVTSSVPDGSIRGSIPLSVVLSWPPPNYVDPVRRSWMAALTIPLAVASSLMIFVRIWSRATRQAGSLGIDDICIIVSWVFVIGLSAVAIVGAEKYGFDRHVWDVPFDEHVLAAMYGWIGDVVFLVSTCLCKIGILLFSRRMVSGTYSKKVFYASWLGIAFTAVYGILFVVLLCTSCKPLNAYWKSYDLNYTGTYKCHQPGAAMAVSGALSVTSDLYAVILPYLLVQNLQIPGRQKYGLYFVFGFGLIVVGCGIARTVFLDQLASKSYDTTWVAFNVLVASLLEAQLSIIGACLPNLRKVFGAYFGDSLSKVYSNLKITTPKSFGSSKKSRNASGQQVPAFREEKIVSTTEDIELVADSVETSTGPVAEGPLQNPTDHEYFEKAYVRRFTNTTLSEHDLAPREDSHNFKTRDAMFPYTVF